MGSKFGSQRGAGLVNTKNAIRTLKPFRSNGALSAETYASSMGVMPDSEREKFYADANAVDYIVYSYSTPIAYHNSITDEWTVPEVKYSVTTSRHQSVVRHALAGI